MKKTCLAFMLLLALVVGSVGFVHAEVLPAYGEGQIGYMAVVLCEELTLRKTASSSGSVVAKLEYGTRIIVMSVEGDWAYCTMGDSEDSPIGYVNADYIAIDPAWYRTTAKTAVYAWNSTDALKVALLEANETLPVLKIEGDWVLVSLRGAVGWVKN